MSHSSAAHTGEPGSPGSAGAGSRPGLIIGLLVVSAFVMILNETIVSVALPRLAVDLTVAATTVQWLTSGFLLTMAVVIPTTGFLLERFTPRTVFLASLTLFTAGALVCAVAPGFAVLLVGRVVQASGTAIMIPLLMTSVMRLVAPERRGTTMGTISIVIAVAPALGPTVGGAVLAGLGWRAMFVLVLVLSGSMLVVGAIRFRLPATTRAIPLDVISVVLSAVGFSGLVFGFSSIGRSGSGALVAPWIPIVVGAAFLACFAWRQVRLQREQRALLDLRPLSHPPFVVAVLLSVLLFMALLGAAGILLPMYLENALGYGTFVTGLAVLPGGLVLGLLSRPVGHMFDRVGARPLVIPGAVGMAASLWLFSLLGTGSSLAAVIGIHILLMASLGLMMTPLMTEALSVLPDSLYSHGSAIMTTLQQVAGALGTAVFVAVAALGSDNPAGRTDAAGLQTAFVVAACVGVVGVAVSFLIRRKPKAPQTDGAQENRELEDPVAQHQP
jgi:DHA2 family lincomycin resistance protein-like MFS transporter